MMNVKRNKYSSKTKDNKNNIINIKESNTLDNKHKMMIKLFNDTKNDKDQIKNEIEKINIELSMLKNDNISLTLRASLLDKKEELERLMNKIVSNRDEMDYYDNAGDLITDYYEMREHEVETKEKYSILECLSKKKETQQEIINKINKTNLFEKYCHRIDGIRLIQDDGSNRIKYCNECEIEKILDIAESAYICPWCGDSEHIIIDEDRQIKDYSPYKRLNHFREWLNQFQAKQSPDIPEQVFIDLVKELNKSRISDLSTLSRDQVKKKLKKLKHHKHYEHIHYIINKLNNLPPPRITSDMEKIFISMFTKIQEPWEIYKPQERKNFMSYSYVLHKFCELLELDHLLDCFSLHKDHEKIMENDLIWEKICKHLNWEYISSFK